MSNYSICKEATPAHAVELLPNLRQADVRECEKLYGCSAGDALLASVATSDMAWAFLNDEEECMGIAGVGDTGVEDYGSIWMVSSDELFERYKLPFLRNAKRMVEEFHQDYPVLTNVVDPHNHVHVKWLAWMGFDFTRVLHIGPLRMPFISFERRHPCAWE